MAVLAGLSTFKGGHRFPFLRGRPRGKIRTLRPPKRVVLPLRARGFVRGEQARLWAEPAPLVKEGDAVKVGQIIARDDEALCSPVLATVSGRVAAIETRPHPFGGESRVVVLEADGRDAWLETEAALEPAALSAEELGRRLYEAGVTVLGREGLPTAYRSSPAEAGQIRTLVVNAVPTEPFVEGDDALMYEAFEAFAGGIKLLRQLLGNVEVHIGIGYHRPRVIEELQERIPQDWCFLHPLLPKYPQGEDEVLIRTLLERRLPAGGLPSDVGALVVDVQTCVAAYEAVFEGRPFVERVVSVAGTAVRGPANVRVRIGTPLSEVLALEAPGVIALDGALRGAAVEELDNAPILPDTRAVVALRRPEKVLTLVSDPGFDKASYTKAYLALPGLPKAADAGLHGLERPCVRCGFCLDVCPQNLAPIMIAEAARDGRLEDARALDMAACVECGLCSYVCPSKIPVMSHIQEGKRAALEEG